MQISQAQQLLITQMPSLPASTNANTPTQNPPSQKSAANSQDTVSISRQAQSLAHTELKEAPAVENQESKAMQISEGEASPQRSLNITA